MIAYLEEIDIRSRLSDSGMPSELDTIYFVAVIEVLRRQATGRTRPLWIFLNKLLDVPTAQIHSPSIGISKIIKDIGELGEKIAPKTLRAWTS